jgi:1-acyl-sn-glycerol-3-phosphate acyltransferase
MAAAASPAAPAAFAFAAAAPAALPAVTAPPSARRVLAGAADAVPALAAASFDGSPLGPEKDSSPAVAPIEARRQIGSRPEVRLRLHTAEELGLRPGSEEPGPRSAPSEPRPFFYRHYTLARYAVLPILSLIYGIRVEGRANLPAGPVVVVPNHVSYMDPILISFAANRPMRFLMYRGFYEIRGLEWLFRALGAIPISNKDPKEVIEESLNRARRALADGQGVVIFPEGTVTHDGKFNPFRRGFERVALDLGAPVLPAGIDGMWGSIFSHHPLANWRRSLLSRLRGRRRPTVRFGPPLARADAGLAREAVSRLVGPAN